MIMINTCCPGQGQSQNEEADNPVWIEQKNYIATAREAMYDSTCNICLMELFDSDQDEDVHCLAGCCCLFHKDCLIEYIKAQLSMGKLPIKCPNTGCETPLNAENDLKMLLN